MGAIVDSGPVEMVPSDAVLDESYLRTLHIDHLVTLLDRYGVAIPDSVDANSATAIVDYVVAEYGAD